MLDGKLLPYLICRKMNRNGRPENQERGYELKLRVVKKGEWKGRIYSEALKDKEMGVGQNGGNESNVL